MAASPLFSSTLRTTSVSVRRLQRPGPASAPTSSRSRRPSSERAGPRGRRRGRRGVGRRGRRSAPGTDFGVGRRCEARGRRGGRGGQIAEPVVLVVRRCEDRRRRCRGPPGPRRRRRVRRRGQRQQDREDDHREIGARDVRADVPPGIDDGHRAPDEEDGVRDDDAEQDGRLEHDPDGFAGVTTGKRDATDAADHGDQEECPDGRTT